MKVAERHIKTAIEMALEDAKNSVHPTYDYDQPSTLSVYPSPSYALTKFNSVEGTIDMLESFIIHLAMIISGEVYAAEPAKVFPSMVDARDVLLMRKSLLECAAAHGDNTFDIRLDVPE